MKFEKWFEKFISKASPEVKGYYERELWLIKLGWYARDLEIEKIKRQRDKFKLERDGLALRGFWEK